MLVTFANFLKLEEHSEHDWRSASGATKNFGRILSSISYFDCDEVSGGQEQLVLAYKATTE